MSNLTFDRKLLQDQRQAEPREGYAVVVFERLGERGDRFHAVLLPGGPPLKKETPLFRKAPDYFAYAVDLTPGQCLRFTEFVRMADHLHDLNVNFEVSFDVAEPREVAAHRDADPLQKIRDRVASTLADDIRQLEWSVVKKGFREAGEGLVARHLSALQHFARRFGIAIQEIRLRERVARDALPVEEEERKAAEARARIALETEVKAAEEAAQHRLEMDRIRLKQERLGAEDSVAAQEEAARHALEMERIRQKKELVGGEEAVSVREEEARHRLEMEKIRLKEERLATEERVAAEEQAIRARQRQSLIGEEEAAALLQAAADHRLELEKAYQRRERLLAEERLASEEEAIRIRLYREKMEQQRDLVELQESAGEKEAGSLHRRELKRLAREQETLALGAGVEALKLQSEVRATQAQGVMTVISNVAANTRTAQEALEAARVAQEIALLRSAILAKSTGENHRISMGCSTDSVLLGGSAPRRAQPGDVVLVQLSAYVAAFEPAARAELERGAQLDDNIRLGQKTDCRWATGVRVSVRCRASGLDVPTPVQQFVWDGECRTVQFDVEVPADAPPRKTVIVLEAFVHDREDAPDAVQVAQLRLPLQIAADASASAEPVETVRAKAAETAFASYATPDRLDVLQRVSSIRRSAGLDVWMEVIDLRIGEEWNPALDAHILSSDRFLLFWSEHTPRSKWVTWERERAVAAHGEDVLELHLLRYTPIDQVPEDLRKYHFNDLYILARDAELYRREQAEKAAAAAAAANAAG